MPHEFIQVENRDGVLILTMHDPPTRNALGPDMAREIVDTLDEFEQDPEQRVLLLTGTEPSFFYLSNVRGLSQRIHSRSAAGPSKRSLRCLAARTKHFNGLRPWPRTRNCAPRQFVHC